MYGPLARSILRGGIDEYCGRRRELHAKSSPGGQSRIRDSPTLTAIAPSRSTGAVVAGAAQNASTIFAASAHCFVPRIEHGGANFEQLCGRESQAECMAFFLTTALTVHLQVHAPEDAS